MRRNVTFAFVVLTAFGSLGTLRVQAQLPPDYLNHYKLVPRASVLHQTGGFAGVDQFYRLLGSYDLQRSIGWTGTASFENAEVWGSIISPYPTPAFVLDVDQLLNLESLKGVALPVAAPFDVYEFTGKTNDGSSVRLLGSLIGPWMYLRGGTQPPEGSADFFKYDIRALARSRPFADLNDDGTVDAADYTLLRRSAAAVSASDAATISDWTQQFGESLPDLSAYDAMLGASLDSLNSSVVPEPAACSLLIIGSVAFVVRRKRWHHAP